MKRSTWQFACGHSGFYLMFKTEVDSKLSEFTAVEWGSIVRFYCLWNPVSCENGIYLGDYGRAFCRRQDLNFGVAGVSIDDNPDVVTRWERAVEIDADFCPRMCW